VPIIWTVFAPLMVAPYLLEGERPQLAEIMRQEPAALERGLAAVAETLAGYAQAAIQFGADGLFYATNVATADFLSAEACRRFQRPFDLPVLEAASSGWFTMLHLCGDGVLFDEFFDYPFDCLSWAAGGSNPGLSELQRRIGRAVVGGLPGKPAIAELTETEAADLALGAIRELDGRWLLLGPGCSINPDTPERVLIAARDAARGAAG
jgi:uroporphyrinogen decarboxylase